MVVSLNSRLESNKEEEVATCPGSTVPPRAMGGLPLRPAGAMLLQEQGGGFRILYEKRIKSKISGNEVYYTA